MDSEIKIGVYICSCGANYSEALNMNKLTEYAKSLTNVIEAKNHSFMCSTKGQNLIINDIKAHDINRVVIAGCKPEFYEPIFRYACEEAGLNPGLLEIVSFGEDSAWINVEDPEFMYNLTKDYVKMGVVKVAKQTPIEVVSIPIEPSCLIVGAGIAGMNAALDLADRGYEVHLVEKEPSIGGRMAQLDKTFPTMDCSACILTPKMSDVGKDKRIHLYTYSEVTIVDGYVGNFFVTIKQKPHYIDQEKCTGCGTCATECPVECGNEFDLGMNSRKAAYIPFPQAVPGTYTIDMEHCIKCGICEEECPADAIRYDDKPRFINLKVGTIIIATGWDPYDPTELKQYRYGKYSNVITGLQMERLLSSYGPTGGKLKRPSDLKEPEKIVFLQCIGSRDFRELGNKYCSRVCCMYATKQARQFLEKHPKSMAFIFYIDLRAFGKGYEEFYESAAREYGIYYIRGRIGDVYENENGDIVVRGEDTLLQQLLEIDADMMVLSVGLEPRADSEQVAKMFDLLKSEDGFFMEAHAKVRPVDTLNEGIFIAGAAQGPKDIPDTVAQAKGAASGAATLIARGKIEIEQSKLMKVERAEPPEIELEQINID